MPDLLSQLQTRGVIESAEADRARRAWETGTALDEAILGDPDADGDAAATGAARVTEDRLLPALAELVGIEFVDLDASPPDAAAVSAFLAEVPAKLLTTHRVLPISAGADGVRVATSRLFDRRGLDGVRLALGRPTVPVLATSDAIDRALATHLGTGAETMQSLSAAKRQADTEAGGVRVLDEYDRDMDLEAVDPDADASIIQFVNQILVEAIRRRATDVHFEPFEKKLVVRYRIDGVLVEASIPREASGFQPAIVSRLKILAQLDIAEKRLPQDGRIRLRVAGRDVDVRVSIIPMLHGEAVVLRLLDRSGALVSLEGAGMGGEHLRTMEDVLQLPHGIVLVTGPTGSGKTTTLYAGLSRINTADRKIVTIEDPIEYHLDGVNQIQVETKTGMTFAKGLRAILRHDPDVILIGEIRDRETAEIAVQASLTGHLVFSTLHTNDAPGAIPRLIDMGVEPYLVASSLELVIAQRLVRLLCASCKQPMPGADATRVRERFGDALPAELFAAQGCRACNGTGYAGRRGVFEMMPVDDTLRQLATGAANARDIRRAALGAGMGSLRDDGFRLLAEGVTTVDEVLRVTKDEAMHA